VQAWNATGGEQVRTLRDAFLAAAGDAPFGEVPPALVTAAEASASEEFSAGHLVGRLGQFFDETFVIVPRAAEALVANDLTEFGRLVDKSQAGAERALENQIAETVHLQRYARELGATAASAFGAGFGGAVWAMVPTVDAERFASRWREKYLRVHHSASHRALFFQTTPSSPAFELV
jgi:galactokinase